MKIAVVSALPVGLNTGMLTVEYALSSLLAGKKKWKIDRYCFERNFQIEHEHFGKIEAKKIDGSDILKSYDKILYWGDFLHWRGYLHKDLSMRNDHGKSKVDFSELEDKYYDVFFLEKNKELLSKAIAFGGTIYPISLNDLMDTRYKSNLLNFLKTAALTRFRDVYSSELARGLIGSSNSFMGMDPAFFLGTKDLIKHDHPKDYLVFSFGRSGQNELLKKVALFIAKQLGLDAYDLQWFDIHNKENLLVKKLKVLRGAKLVLTDIYHMAVNSFRENKTTYMFGNGASYAMTSLSDKKKEILFKQYLMEPNYIYTELIKNDKFMMSVLETIKRKMTQQENHSYDYLNSQIEMNQSSLLSILSKK